MHLLLWSSHIKRKANVKATSLYWVHGISSLPATPSGSDFARDVTGNWIQNLFFRDFAGKLAFALMWLDHCNMNRSTRNKTYWCHLRVFALVPPAIFGNNLLHSLYVFCRYNVSFSLMAKKIQRTFFNKM